MRSIDLNLFKVFDAVMRHGSVTAAGRELGVTPSAVSHGLNRLRRLLNDELFIPTSSGVEPTARATELAADVNEGVWRLANAARDRNFLAAEAIRHFTLAASDYVSTLLLPGLAARLAAEAPGLTVTVFPTNRDEIGRFIESRGVDLLVTWTQNVPPRFSCQTIGHDGEAVLVRAGHPLAADPAPDRTRLLAFPHVVVELTGTAGRGNNGFMDDRGIERRTWNERLVIDDDGGVGRVGITVPTYGPVPGILCRTDMVATVPRRIAGAMTADGRLVALALPYQPLVFPIDAVWHARDDEDPGLRWLVARLRAVLADA